MKSISKTMRDWFMRDRDRHYVSTLPEPAQEDLGLVRSDALEAVKGRTDTRERLLSMAARFGLTAEDIDHHRQTSIDVALTCGKCVESGVCARYLAGESDATPEMFCPNAEKYAELAQA